MSLPLWKLFWPWSWRASHLPSKFKTLSTLLMELFAPAFITTYIVVFCDWWFRWCVLNSIKPLILEVKAMSYSSFISHSPTIAPCLDYRAPKREEVGAKDRGTEEGPFCTESKPSGSSEASLWPCMPRASRWPCTLQGGESQSYWAWSSWGMFV